MVTFPVQLPPSRASAHLPPEATFSSVPFPTTGQTGGPQPGAMVHPRGRLAKSGDTFGCHSWGGQSSRPLEGGRCYASFCAQGTPQPPRTIQPALRVVPRCGDPALALDYRLPAAWGVLVLGWQGMQGAPLRLGPPLPPHPPETVLGNS